MSARPVAARVAGRPLERAVRRRRPAARLRQLALAVLELLEESVAWPAPQRLSEAAPPPERWWRIV